MKLRKIYTLVVLWCVFMIAPALLLELGLFGPFNMNKNISGGAAGLWIGGYLAQFGIFMWLMNIVGEQKILWWFGASLLPWALDWTVPASPLYYLVWLPVTMGQAGWIVLAARQAETFLERGIKAKGVVLEVLKPLMNVVINNVYIKRKVRLRIEREDGVAAYEGILNGLFMLGEIPSPGDRIPLLVDPEKPQRFEFDKGAETTHDAAAPRSSLRTSPETHGGNLAEQLEQLSRLHERGALTQAEFEAAKRKLLRG